MASAAPVASLPMYDWPEVVWANDALWKAIAERLVACGIAAPATLERERASDAVWRDRALVVSQVCGFPFSTRFRGIVKIVGTPIYEVPGCEGPNYSSMIVVRKEETAERLADVTGRRFVYNNPDSLSGYLAFGAAVKEAGIHRQPANWIQSGSHRASIRAVAADEADVATVDSVCWALAGEHEKEAVSRLRVLGQTPFRPAPPVVTAAERRTSEVQAIRDAVRQALSDPSTKAARAALFISGLGVFDEWDYSPIAALGREFA